MSAILVGIKQEELERILASAFEHNRGRGYFYNDANYDCPALHVNIYDKLLSFFDDDKRRVIESNIEIKMSEPGINRIMDQGCGHANTLHKITHRFAEKYPTEQFLGYGVSGDLNAMWLGSLKHDWDLTIEEKELIEKYNIHPFKSFSIRDKGSNVNFFGIEKDVHKVMKDFPYKLDLVISDNTYFHLMAPWMALKRTADRLSVGGVVMVRTIFLNNVDYISQKQISQDGLLNLLRRNNPDYEIMSSYRERDHRVLAIIKRGETDFKTNFHLSFVSEGDSKCIRSFYSKNPKREDLIAIDEI